MGWGLAGTPPDLPGSPTTPALRATPPRAGGEAAGGEFILLGALMKSAFAFTGTLPEVVPGVDNIIHSPLEGVEMLNLWMCKRVALRLEPVRLRNPGKDRLNVSA